MIEYFNEVPVRQSGVIFSSMFDQIKKMYEVDPDTAGELAISAIELVLTGQISTDNPMIDMMLTPAKVINENNVQKYEVKKENTRAKKIKDMKLQEIADMFFKRGIKQKEIAERLGLSQQTVSYRLSAIRTSYPELMRDEGSETANFYKKSECLQKNGEANLNVYQNTNGTKSENLVSLVNLQNGKSVPTKESDDLVKIQTFSSESGFLQKNGEDVYQNTKNTKNQNFVKVVQNDDKEYFGKNPSQSDDPFFNF